MATSFSANKQMYETQFAAAQTTAKFANEAMIAAKQAIANKAKIDPIAAKWNVPWFVIAVTWCINTIVLPRAGIATIGNDAVDAVKAALEAGRGQLITPRNSAQPGDIVIMGAAAKAHIGIYMGNGKTLSNSSSKASFSWEDTFEAFEARYGSCNAYRVLK